MSGVIFLTGMPGSGKTSLAEALSRRYGLPFADTDRMIEDAQQADIPELFARYGAGAFRRMEHELLRKLAAGNFPEGIIIACGGGMPCYCGNMQLMKETGCVVYLRASVATLADRVSGDTVIRPLLPREAGTAAIRTRLEELLDEREQIYAQAHYIFDVETVSLANFAEIISRCTNRH